MLNTPGSRLRLAKVDRERLQKLAGPDAIDDQTAARQAPRQAASKSAPDRLNRSRNIAATTSTAGQSRIRTSRAFRHARCISAAADRAHQAVQSPPGVLACQVGRRNFTSSRPQNRAFPTRLGYIFTFHM
jgi:hypothetical protein